MESRETALAGPHWHPEVTETFAVRAGRCRPGPGSALPADAWED
jgi:hypothetical protein